MNLVKSKLSTFQTLRNLARPEQKYNHIKTANRMFWVFMIYICAKTHYIHFQWRPGPSGASPGQLVLSLAQAKNRFLYFEGRKREKELWDKN